MPPRIHIEYYEDESGEFRWRKRAANGEIVSVSGEGYTRRGDCLEAIEREFNGEWPINFVKE